MIRGIGTSKGIGMGQALLMESPKMDIQVRQIADVEAEKERYCAAKEQFIA